MTCIVGLVDAGCVYIGGDSAGSSGWDLTIRRDKKVFRNGAFLLGFTSSFRMGQLLHYAFTPPAHPEGMDTEHYLVTLFADGVRDCLKTGGFAKKSSEQESGGTFLIGYRGRLFCVADDYQVGEALDGYDACGCGEEVARGALFATSSSGHELLAVSGYDPSWRVRRALEAAERWNNGVRGPFTIEVLLPGK